VPKRTNLFTSNGKSEKIFMVKLYRKSGSRLGNHIVIELKHKDEEKQSAGGTFSKITSFASQWSQVFTLIVVVFGYFYTVIPVFQKEKLSEDIARLELENNVIKKNVERSQNEMALAEASFESLATEYAIKKEEIDRLNREYEKVEASLKIAINDLHNKNQQIKDVVRKIYDVEKEYMQGKRRLPGEFIARFKTDIAYDVFKKDKSLKLADQLKEYFPEPIAQGNKNLEQLRLRISESTSDLNKEALEKLFTDYRNGLKKHEVILSCNTPDYMKWGNSFDESFSLAMKNIDSCVAHHFNNIATEKGWSKSDLRSLQKSEFWGKQESINREVCTTAFELLMEKLYREHWEYVVDPCMERLENLSVIVLDDFKTDSLKKLVDTSPPTEEQIKIEVANMIVNWN
jgi:Asp-tRNA(Asn)/Glu-tRNA(Gln) amidotransferase C subunit